MTDDAPYSKREIDVFLQEQREAHLRMEAKMDRGFAEMIVRQDFTNGKIRKIIVCMAIIGGLIIGAGFQVIAPYLVAAVL